MPRTILVTGATGYIAKHIVAGLLNRGHSVVGSARSVERDAEMRSALEPALDEKSALERFQTKALDLTSDVGWADAMSGVDAVIHTASPFPLASPKDENEVIRPAVDGVRRMMTAASNAGIRRIVLTSSSGAITVKDAPGSGAAFDEDDWTDLNHPAATPYFKSKTLAERAAWDFATDHPEMALTVINPCFVVGPPLDASFGTSIRVIERLLKGKDPMLPRFGFPTVDVRDVAEAHIRALDTPEAEGERILVGDRFLWFLDLAQAIEAALPDRRIVTREAPNFVIRTLALFDREVRTIVPILGRREDVTNSKARRILGLEFRNALAAAGETARWLDKNGIA